MSIDHKVSEIYNLRIWEVILIGDNTILSNYREFMQYSSLLNHGTLIALRYDSP